MLIGHDIFRLDTHNLKCTQYHPQWQKLGVGFVNKTRAYFRTEQHAAATSNKIFVCLEP